MFKKYPSIENSYRNKIINLIQQYYPHEDWICTEKIHGANFSIIIQDEIKFGKRSGLIKAGENFYSYHLIKDELINIGETLRKELGNSIIYGELCGGSYPHPEVEKQNHSTVQKGVYYSPKTEFYIFDIMIDEEFIDHHRVIELCEQYNFLHARILKEGTLEECLDYPNKFQTTIPRDLGLPEIENNFCEGTVIKPRRSLFFPRGSRVILKNKNEIFSEKQEKKINIEYIRKLSDEEKIQLDELSKCMTENRLRNVISKIGEINPKDFGKLHGLFVQDILIEGEEVNKKIKRELQIVAAEFIRERFIDICDNEF